MKEKISEGFIDVEPTWESLVPLFCEFLEVGNEEQRRIAREEILKMARVTDKFRQTQKRGKTMMRIPKEKPAKPAHDFRVGDILEHTWGYDQTNVDFYQVVELKTKTIVLREIQSVEKSTGHMTGKVTPVKNSFEGEPFRRRPYKSSFGWMVNINGYTGGARKWNGKEQPVTHYA
jgi:hypothetical protein